MSIKEKIYRIGMEADKRKYRTVKSLSNHIFSNSFSEFSYFQKGKTYYCGLKSIEMYIFFSQTIGVLDKNYSLSVPNKNIYMKRSTFYNWLGNKVFSFNNNHGMGISKLQTETNNLVFKKKILPTAKYLYEAINPKGVTYDHFKWLIRLQYLLRPATLEVCRSWMWIPHNTFTY